MAKHYVIRKLADSQHHVFEAGDDGQAKGKSISVHQTRQHAAAKIKTLMAANSTNAADSGSKASDRPTDPDDYAVPDTKQLPIHDRKHLGLAIAALSGDKNAPHGHGVDLTPAERKQAVSRIHAKIGDLANDDADKADLLARLKPHIGAKYWGDGDFEPDMDGRPYADTFADSEDDFGYEDDSKALAEPDELIDAEPITKRNLLEAVKQALFGLPDVDEAPLESVQGFKAFGPDNQYWVAFFSNNAQDRDGEWFSEKAHDEAIRRLDSGEAPMPQLDYWHSKAYHGQAFWVDRIGHVMMAVGTFYDDPFSQGMKEYYANSATDDDLVSFGFHFPVSQRVDHVYHDYTPFEISPLPAAVAANEWTGFANLQEFKSMNVSEQKRKELERRLGPALAKQLLAQAGQKSAAIDQVETSFKALDATNPLEAQVAALSEAVLVLAGRKDTDNGKIDAKPDRKTGQQGQPNSRADQNDDDEVWDDTDDEDQDNFGALNPKEMKQLKRLLAKAKAAQADPDDDSDDDTDGEDDDAPPAKKSSKARRQATSEIGLKEVVTGYKTINDNLGVMAKAIQRIFDNQTQLGNKLNTLSEDIYNPQPASRSPYTVVPPDDPAMEALKQRMVGDAPGNTAPNAPAEGMGQNEWMQFLFGQSTAFANGRH